MSLRRIVKLASPNSVAAGQTAVYDLPLDRRYHSITLQYKTNANQATIESDIEEIRIKIDGAVQRVFSAAQLNTLRAFAGGAFVAGMIPIEFSDPQMRNRQSEDLLAWGMDGVSTFQIEVDIASGATSPTLGGIAEIDNAIEAPVGIVKWARSTVPVSSTGQRLVRDLPKRDSYRRVHLFESTDDDISNVEISLDQLVIYDLSRAQHEYAMAQLVARGTPFAPQAAVWSIAFDKTLVADATLPMINPRTGRPLAEFAIDLTIANAGNITVIAETLGNPNGWG